ncbi:ATP synthase F1 subunit epsilon [Tyzzerella sp. OttesenSCG-928-J15]|nr:ATP synthase F1 subunit epsilon [Tyzzerella sp. OttesenSCG-928-J15]
MPGKIRLRIITPARQLFDKDVDMVSFKSTEGEIGILPGHSPLTCVLSYSVMRIKEGSDTLYASVMSGFAEITGETVTILSDAAEWPDEIDIDRAQAAKERAARIIEKGDSIDVERAKLALRRAAVRIEVSGYRSQAARTTSSTSSDS